MNRIPSREQVERLRQRYPAGTRIVLHSMDDAQAPPPGTMGTVVYVDDMTTSAWISLPEAFHLFSAGDSVQLITSWVRL